MSARENLSPGFSISHSIPEVFPSREDYRTWGYEPLDVYLEDEVDGNTLYDTRTFMEGDTAGEFFDNFRDDYMLVFRYIREDVDPLEEEPPENPDMPAYKAEAFPVSVSPDGDMLRLEELITEGSEPLQDAFYSQALDISEEGTRKRYKSPSQYVDVATDSEIVISPPTKGVSEIEMNPGNSTAMMFVHEDETRMPERRQGFGTYSSGEPFEMTRVKNDRDDQEIDRLKDELEAMGFRVETGYVPPE